MRMAPPAPQPTHAPSSTVQTANTVDRCRAMWNTIRRSRPDSGPGCSIFKVRVKYSFHVVPFLLGSGPARILDTRGARSHNCDRSSPPPKQKSCSMYYGERAVERRERGQRERENRLHSPCPLGSGPVRILHTRALAPTSSRGGLVLAWLA